MHIYIYIHQDNTWQLLFIINEQRKGFSNIFHHHYHRKQPLVSFVKILGYIEILVHKKKIVTSSAEMSNSKQNVIRTRVYKIFSSQQPPVL